MRITSLLLLLSIFFSCTTETKKTVSVRNELSEYIQKRYQPADLSSTSGTETKNGKTETTYEVSVGQSKIIDDSRSSPELFASDIAFRLYCGMNKTERRKYDIFAVKIKQKNHTTEIRYKNERLKEANANLLWLDGFFRLVNQKEYAFAKAQFNTKLVDTSTVDLQSIYEPLSFNMGKLKKQELQGFEIYDTKVESKTYRILKATYISFYDKQYTLSSYFLLMDEPEQKLVNLEIK